MSVSEDDLRDLIELEATLQALAETPGWQTLKNRAEQRIEEQQRRVMSGAMANHDEYMKLVNQILGAQYVLHLPEEISALVLEYRKVLVEQSGEEE